MERSGEKSIMLMRSFKRHLFYKYLILFIFSTSMLSAGNIEMPLMYENVLPNGLKVVLIPMEGRQDMCLSIMHRVGRRDEVDENQKGISSFLIEILHNELMNSYDSSFTSSAVQCEFAASADYSYISLYASMDHKKLLISSLENIIISPKFDETNVYETYINILKKKKIEYSKEDEIIRKEVADNFFGPHPYGHKKFGDLKQLSAQSNNIEMLRAFHKKNYRPDNSILFVTGGFLNTGEIYKLIEKYFSYWEKGYKPRIIPRYPDGVRTDSKYFQEAYTKNIISFNWRFPNFPREDIASSALILFDRHLFLTNSELTCYLKNEANLIDGISTNIFQGRDLWTYRIDIHVKKSSDVDFVYGYFKRSMGDKILYPSNSELLSLQNSIENEIISKTNEPLQLNRLLIPASALNMDVKEYYMKNKQILNLGLFDIKTMHTRYLDPDKALIIILTED